MGSTAAASRPIGEAPGIGGDVDTVIYIAVDGDDVGRVLTRLIYSDDEAAVAGFSEQVRHYYQGLADLVLASGGSVIFCAGDSVLARVPGTSSAVIEQYLAAGPFTSSAGVGETLRQAHWALNMAKSLGKNRLVDFADVRRGL